MKARCLVFFCVLTAVVAVAWVPLAGQVPRAAEPRRTAWGDPDLQGIWRAMTQVNLERLNEFEGREFLTDTEVAARERAVADKQARVLAGKAEFRGYRDFPVYNASYETSDDRLRISRRTSAIIDPPDGRLPPWTPEQLEQYEARQALTRGRGEADSWIDRSDTERCLNIMHIPKVSYWGMSYGGNAGSEAPAARADVVDVGGFANRGVSAPIRRILQAPGYVAMVMEEQVNGEYHIIPLERRRALGPQVRQWLGSARGHWDGNTLVVETTNIYYGGRNRPLLTYGSNQYPGSGDTLTLTERYTRVDADTIEYRYTIDDPGTYIRPYTAVLELTRDDNYKVAPTLCHESNSLNLAGILANARADEESALKYAAEAARNRQRRLEELKAEWAARDTRP